MSGSCPAISFTAGTHGVTTIHSTIYQPGTCTDVRRGALLEIQGRQSNDGKVLAEQIHVENDGPGVAGLLSDVGAGGYVLFFRHSERDAGAISIPTLAAADNNGDCRPGSELTENGKADAVALGERFARYGIVVQKVYASPTCRTTQMATLAFGTFETTRALTWPGMWTGDESSTLTPRLRQLLATVPAPGGNIVLIAHNDVMTSDRVGVSVALDQAEAALFRPHGGDSFEFLGKIPKAEWMGRR